VTPEQEEQVRRALGALARQEPVTPLPEDVADRLDAVLAGLADTERDGAAAGPLPAPDRPAQRHRRWSTVLVAAAAAAVVVLAGGVVGLRELNGSGTPRSEAGAAASRTASASRSPGATRGPEALNERGPASITRSDVPLLRTATLTRDVQRVVDGGLVPSVPRPAANEAGRMSPGAASGTLEPGEPSTVPSGPASGAASGAASGPVDLTPSAGRLPGCAAPPAGRGVRLLAVRLDRRPAWLAVPVRAGTRVARVYACGSTGSPLASTSVHVP
jgi:hypothetical protein